MPHHIDRLTEFARTHACFGDGRNGVPDIVYDYLAEVSANELSDACREFTCYGELMSVNGVRDVVEHYQRMTNGGTRAVAAVRDVSHIQRAMRNLFTILPANARAEYTQPDVSYVNTADWDTIVPTSSITTASLEEVYSQLVASAATAAQPIQPVRRQQPERIRYLDDELVTLADGTVARYSHESWSGGEHIVYPVGETPYRLTRDIQRLIGPDFRQLEGIVRTEAGPYTYAEDCIRITRSRSNGGPYLANEYYRIEDTDHYGIVQLHDGRWTYHHESAVLRDGRRIISCEAAQLDNGTSVHINDVPANMQRCQCCRRYGRLRDGKCRTCRRNDNVLYDYCDRTASEYHSESYKPYRIGVELEFGTINTQLESIGGATRTLSRRIPERYAIFKHDGSLRQFKGFEMVTRPDAPEVHKRILQNCFGKTTRRFLMTNKDQCGVHIHVGKDTLSDVHIARIVALVNHRNLRRVVAFVAQRESAQWARLLTVTLPTAYRKTTNHRGCDKYEAVNLRNANTIEFRIFAGTTSADELTSYIEFVEAVIDYTKVATRSLTELFNRKKFLQYVQQNKKQYPKLQERFEQCALPSLNLNMPRRTTQTGRAACTLTQTEQASPLSVTTDL